MQSRVSPSVEPSSAATFTMTDPGAMRLTGLAIRIGAFLPGMATVRDHRVLLSHYGRHQFLLAAVKNSCPMWLA
jgi:hypothetical protein